MVDPPVPGSNPIPPVKPGNKKKLGKILGGVFGGLGGLAVTILFCIYGREPLWDWLRERCSCDLCGKLLDLSKYLLYIVIGMIIGVLILPFAIVVIPFSLPVLFFKWLRKKLKNHPRPTKNEERNDPPPGEQIARDSGLQITRKP